LSETLAHTTGSTFAAVAKSVAKDWTLGKPDPPRNGSLRPGDLGPETCDPGFLSAAATTPEIPAAVAAAVVIIPTKNFLLSSMHSHLSRS
jgi:hypothetical protein